MTTSSRTKTAVAVLAVAGAVAAGVLVVASISGATASSHRAAATTLPTVPTTLAPTSTTLAPTTTTTAPTTTTTVDDGTLRVGKSGPEVTALQDRLTALGFWLGASDGQYSRLTQQAVMAFQKANGLHRDGSAGPATLAALATAGRPAPRSTADGVEIDLERQILIVVEGGQAKWTFNTSSGKPSTSTPPGDYAVYKQIDGIRRAPLGDLYRPKYFHGGDAVHGSPSIPGYAASHGCARVSNPAMDFLWASGNLEVGTPVRVH